MVNSVGTELRATLPGTAGTADARRALAVLDRFLSLVGQLEDVALNKRATRADERSVWGLTDVRMGSLTVTIAPNEPRRGATTRTLSDVATWVVEGLSEAEERDGLPAHWDRHCGESALNLAQLLGYLPATGLVLQLLANGEVVQEVTVTRRTEEHLRVGLSVRHQSIGSAIGRLDSVGLHDRREAGLWLETTGERVTVYFAKDQIEVIRKSLGRRVEVAGRLTRDVDGKLLTIQMRTLEILREQEGPDLTDLVGLDPGMTGGASPSAYLRELRGAS
jgi:hypothetical protein